MSSTVSNCELRSKIVQAIWLQEMLVELKQWVPTLRLLQMVTVIDLQLKTVYRYANR